MLRGILTHKRDELTGSWRKLHIEGPIICTLHQVNEDDMGSTCSMRGEMTCITFLFESLKGRGHLKDVGTHGWISLKSSSGNRTAGI
jgi:hypothetical protein